MDVPISPNRHSSIENEDSGLSTSGRLTSFDTYAEFLFINVKIFLHYLSFLNIEKAQAVDILPHERQGPVYPAYWIP